MKTKKKTTKKQKEKKEEEEKEEEEEETQTIPPPNYFKRRARTIKEKVREWYLKKYKANEIIMINLELKSGKHRTILITTKNEGFKHKGRKYLLDNENEYYNTDFGYKCYDFHEDLCLPVKRKIPVDLIKTTLEQSPITEVEYAINPTTLERFETSKIAEGIMKGQQIDEFMKRVMMILIILLLATTIHLIIYLQKSGVFDQVKGSLPI